MAPNDFTHSIFRKPLRTIAEAKAERFADVLHEMQDRAARHFGKPPIIAVTLFSDGTAIVGVSDYANNRREQFGGFSTPLPNALAELESWLSSDPVADGYATLGLDRSGSRILETGTAR